MNLQIRIWISNVVLFVVPILIAIILFLLYFSGLRILANAGYYLRIEQEQQFKSVSRVAETITFYGLDNGLIDSLVKPSYSLFDEIIKTSYYEIKPITPEDAVLKLKEHPTHNFLVFINVETGKVNAIHKLKDGKNFGLVEPEA